MREVQECSPNYYFFLSKFWVQTNIFFQNFKISQEFSLAINRFLLFYFFYLFYSIISCIHQNNPKTTKELVCSYRLHAIKIINKRKDYEFYANFKSVHRWNTTLFHEGGHAFIIAKLKASIPPRRAIKICLMRQWTSAVIGLWFCIQSSVHTKNLIFHTSQEGISRNYLLHKLAKPNYSVTLRLVMSHCRMKSPSNLAPIIWSTSYKRFFSTT